MTAVQVVNLGALVLHGLSLIIVPLGTSLVFHLDD
jgi:hypothetical protein